MLWRSPTDGPPIDLATLPTDCGLIAVVRPGDLQASDEGQRLLRALGPSGDALRAAWTAADNRNAKVAVFGVGPGESYGQPRIELALDPATDADEPLLPREFESLLVASDTDRHATLVFSPRFLLGDGGSLLSGPAEPLRELLLAIARDEWKAASLSLHADDRDRLYWELRLLGTAAQAETRLAAQVHREANAWPDSLGDAVSSTNWTAYSQALIERAPAMLDVLVKHARSGVEGRQAVLNGYLPPGAGHQLALAAERLIAEWGGIGTPRAGVAEAAADTRSVAEKLASPVTVRFPRESLETALTIIGDAAGASIRVRGRDLQLEGITRNQMVSLNVTDEPAADALVRLLRQANPDPLAEGPADSRQRLVYVVRDASVEVTTRAAAADRGDPLPEAFLPPRVER